MPKPSVPLVAQGVPAAVKARAIQWAHEVLPLVPVMPITRIFRLGTPYHWRAMKPARSGKSDASNWEQSMRALHVQKTVARSPPLRRARSRHRYKSGYPLPAPHTPDTHRLAGSPGYPHADWPRWTHAG